MSLFFSQFSAFFKEYQNDFDAIVFDIDGTLAIGLTPLPGVQEFLEELNALDFPYLLMTNDSGRSPEEKAGRLKKAGLPITAEQIFSSGTSLKYWAEKNYRGGLFFQYGDWGNPSFVQAAGIETTTDPEQINECCGVLAGEGIFEWRKPLEAAFNLLLKHPEYPLLVGNPDGYWPSMRKEGFGIGSGGLARAIVQVLREAGRIVEPIYLGKPYPLIYQGLPKFLSAAFPDKSFSLSRLLAIGDSLNSDVAGAKNNGMKSALLLTGITDMDMLKSASAEQLPDWIFQGV